MTLMLTPQDCERYRQIVQWEMEIRRYARDQLLEVAHAAERLMHDISEREGTDLTAYDINWQTGEASERTNPFQ
jgi:phosphatidylserine decarboxylase